jgi:hypothetical protein
MSLISMMEARLPPGFRFHPRDDELVLDYLCRKLSGEGGGGGGAYGGIAMVDVDLNKCEPWELPGTCLCPSCSYDVDGLQASTRTICILLVCTAGDVVHSRICDNIVICSCTKAHCRTENCAV